MSTDPSLLKDSPPLPLILARAGDKHSEAGFIDMIGGIFSAIGRVFGLHSAPPPIAPKAKVRSAPIIHPSMDASVSVQHLNAAEQASADTEPVLLRREIVDAKLDVCAYEFSLRGDLHENVLSQRRSVRTFMDRMLIDHVNSINAAVLRERLIFIPLAESSVLSSATDNLPAHSCIVISPEHPERPADTNLLNRIDALKAAGVQIWADDCANTAWLASAEPLLNGVTVRVAARMPMEISEIFEALTGDYPNLAIAAWDVNTMEEFEAMRSLGCVSFSGGFITQRGNWSGKPLSPQVMCVAMLVTQVREDADMHKIAAILRQDMAMSYRLMRYVNAAAHGLNHQISSVEQALLLLGQAQLDRWLTLMMLSRGLGGNGAIIEAALVRARFMELLGEGHRGKDISERLFVLGLFSMLDLALQVPLEEAIRPLNLPTPMRDALLEKKGTLGSFLALAEASQASDSQRVMQHAVALGLTVRKVNARHIEALTWVNAPETTIVKSDSASKT